MKKDMTRVLVESTVRRTLKNIEESPHRETRNLVDLGLQFSSGRFQTRLLRQAQTMLQNQRSAYYDLVRRIVTTVDHDVIATFGVNLGYNSCTKGARQIREIEAERGCNIPWALNLVVNAEKLAAEPDCAFIVFLHGSLRTHTEIRREERYNIFSHGLEEILRDAADLTPLCGAGRKVVCSGVRA